MKAAIWIFLTSFLVVSCDNQTTLQEYYVENQAQKEFIALDIPASLVTGANSTLSGEQRATLETVEKINFLAFPKKEENQAQYEQEKEKVAEILKDEKYQQLMRFGKNGLHIQLYYSGEEDAIDELVIYGTDETKGFGLARVTGNDMDPEAMIRLMKSFEKGNLDLSGLPDLQNAFKD